MTASCSIIHSTLTYKFMRPVSILWLPKEKKTKNAKTANSKKKH